jgi:hypothetical protein
MRKMAKEGVAGAAFDRHVDGGAVAGSEDQVALIVAGYEPGFDFRRAFIGQHHVLELALGRCDAAAAGTADGVGADAGRRAARVSVPPGHDVNVAVDRLVAGLRGGQIGVVAAETAGHFLRRPAST